MNPATIESVSQQAGVSKTTVSRYLNGKFEHMSAKTKARIKETIEALDYQPNLIARSLKLKKTGLIGVIVPDIINPVTVNLVKGVIDHCTQEGYQVVIASSDEQSDKEKEYVLSMLNRKVEGLIVNIADYNNYDLLKTLTERGEKIVLADRTICDSILDMVTTDNYNMTRTVVKALYEKGYEAVGFFSPELLKSNVRLTRYNAFLDESAGKLAYLLHNENEYKKAIQDFLSKTQGKKAAIFASTPMSLLNVVSGIHELNLKTPEDIGICGYDNLPWTKLVGGGISVVEQPLYEVGWESAKILIDRIKNGIDNPVKYVELKSKLILRNSTGDNVTVNQSWKEIIKND
ncbi:MAG: LacI family transcriptional regulator [Defluviitaleaceae bacterium]|nr:LacI family transcriptional regulator [Defluviitaleaceae bacterium]